MKAKDLWPSVDPLGEALHFLRMSGSFYCRSEVTAPWSVTLPAVDDCLMFHVVTAGECWIAVPGVEPRLLRPGDFALVPHGQGHAFYSDPEVPTVSLFDLPRQAATKCCATAVAARRPAWSVVWCVLITRRPSGWCGCCPSCSASTPPARGNTSGCSTACAG